MYSVVTSVLICDDLRAVRDGLRRAVESLPGIDRVDTAGTGEEVLARWPKERHDLVLMDVQMPGLGGVEATRRLVRDHPEANIVMLTVASDREAAAAAIAGGARGFLHKDVSREELCATLANVLTVTALSPGVAPTHPARPFDADAPVLTERERQVLELLCEGLSAPQIAGRLYLGTTTVKSHLGRLYEKLGVSDRAAAVAEAMRRGIVE